MRLEEIFLWSEQFCRNPPTASETPKFDLFLTDGKEGGVSKETPF